MLMKLMAASHNGYGKRRYRAIMEAPHPALHIRAAPVGLCVLAGERGSLRNATEE